MLHIRQPAVAGAFYPAQKQILMEDINALLDASRYSYSSHPDKTGAPPKAIIVPHAGYIYSGEVAAAAYTRLASAHDTIKRVILLGPVHRVPVRGLALPGFDAFATPLGEVQIDHAAVTAIEAMRQIVISPEAHAPEHSLEVQLPFLQSVLDDFKIVPLAVGDATPAEVAEVLDALWGDAETLIVVSSDLSHFFPYQTAQVLDSQTVKDILSLEYHLNHEQACGGTPVNGLLLAARRHHLQPHLLDLRNSGDTAGDKSRVVGYASFAFTEEAADDSG